MKKLILFLSVNAKLQAPTSKYNPLYIFLYAG